MTTVAPKPAVTDTVAPKFMTPGTQVLVVLAIAGGLAALYRLAFGLGAATNMSDAHPGGLWIAADDLTGIALAAGGYSMGAAWYVFRMKRYQPVVRPAILTAFLGYLIAATGVVLDLGRPWAVWRPFVSGQPRSVMFAVAVCVVAVLIVLALEFAPVAAQGLKRESLRKKLDAFMVPLVILGLVLSFIHQSSLGALFLLMKGRLSELWYSPLLPVHFFLSSVIMGMAMVSFESIASARAFRRPYEAEILQGLARGAQIALGLYLVVRLADLIGRGNLGLAFAFDRASLWFLLEILGGAVLPLVLYSMSSVRHSIAGLTWASSLAVAGVVLNRFNVTFFSQADARVPYFPALGEILVTAGLIAFLLLAYKFLVRHLPVLAHEPEPVGRA